MQRHLRLHSANNPTDAPKTTGSSSESRSSGRSVVGQLRHWSKRWPADQTVSLLDIASDSVDVPVMVRRWAISAGVDVRVTGVVGSGQSLERARECVQEALQDDSRLGSGIELKHIDALKLTEVFAPQSFDYVHAGALLQELHEIELLTVLRIMDRLASRGIIWTGCAGFTKREVLNCAKRLDLTYCWYSHRILSPRFVLAGEKAR